MAATVPAATAAAVPRFRRQTVAGLAAAVGATVVAAAYSAVNPGLSVMWIFGLAFGFVLQRSRFCFASAFRDLYLANNGRVMKGIIAGMAVATVGFTFLMYKTSPDMARIPVGNITPTGFHTLLGGILFGLGMVLAGGCASGTLYRMGEGYLASWVAMAGALAGMFLLSLHWDWWWHASVVVSSRLWLPQALGWAGAVAANLSLLGAAYAAVLWWESRPGVPMPPTPPSPPAASFSQRLTDLWGMLLGRAWPATAAGAILGVINVFEYMYKSPWGVTTEMSRWAGWLAYWAGYPAQNLLYFGGKPAGFGLLNNLPWLSGAGLLNFGMISGSLVAALLASEFKVRRAPRAGRYAQALLGGMLWGYGSRLAMGCNLGSFFSAIPTLAVSGWLFGLGLAIGSYVGVLTLRRLA